MENKLAALPTVVAISLVSANAQVHASVARQVDISLSKRNAFCGVADSTGTP